MKPVREEWYSAEVTGGLMAYPALATATLGKVVPIASPYTAEIGLTLADVTIPDTTGLEPIVQSGAPDVYTDPGTGDTIINLNEPAGGWQWITGEVPDPAVNIYGYALLNAAENALEAVTEPLAGFLTLDDIGQGIDAGSLTVRVPLGTIS